MAWPCTHLCSPGLEGNPVFNFRRSSLTAKRTADFGLLTSTRATAGARSWRKRTKRVTGSSKRRQESRTDWRIWPSSPLCRLEASIPTTEHTEEKNGFQESEEKKSTGKMMGSVLSPPFVRSSFLWSSPKRRPWTSLRQSNLRCGPRGGSSWPLRSKKSVACSWQVKSAACTTTSSSCSKEPTKRRLQLTVKGKEAKVQISKGIGKWREQLSPGKIVWGTESSLQTRWTDPEADKEIHSLQKRPPKDHLGFTLRTFTSMW